MTEENTAIRQATAADMPAIVALLEHAELGTDGVLAPGTTYWVAEQAGALIGAIGVEHGAGAVLLRSMAVERAARGRNLGAALTEHALAAAQAQGYRAAYLFSTDAGPYWQRRGFREVPVPELVAALPEAPQVRHYDQLGWLPTEIAFRRDL